MALKFFSDRGEIRRYRLQTVPSATVYAGATGGIFKVGEGGNEAGRQ
jgi:hypothetical protein